MIHKKTLLALGCLLFVAACGGSEQEREIPQAEPAGASSADIGDHVVHFNAQATDQLPPEIARAYNIVRSKNRAMLNVSVVSDADGKSVPANVIVNTVNLTGQRKNVTMRRIDEGNAIYYIGETPVANRETLIFDISVQPDGVASPSDVRFQRQFYSDG